MEIVGQVGLRVVPVTDQFPRGVQDIINRTEAANTARIKPVVDTRQIDQNITQIAGSITGQIGGAWTQAAISAASFTAAVVTARFAVNQLISRMGALFDGLQKAQIGFKSLLGEQAGNNLLESIRQFAKESPFETGELVQYSQQLIGVGLEAKKVIPLLTTVGDLVASKGGDTTSIGRILFVLTQIQAVGRLTGQDALQLQSALIPITKLLADYLGKTQAEVKKLQEQGKISAETVFTAISNSGEKVAGAMNASVRTIQGAQSYLNDSILITFQNSKALRSIYDDIVQGIIKFADIISSPAVQASIDEFLESIGGLYTEAKPAIEAFLESFGQTGLTTLTVFTTTLETFNTIMAAIPTGVIENLARGLALLVAIRTPLALIKYVQQLSSLTQVLPKLKAGLGGSGPGSVLGQTAATANATDNLMGKYAKIGGIAVLAGGLIGGEAIKGLDKANASYQALGSAVEGAAIGFAVGGPIGAAIGGLGGVIKGVFDASTAASKAFKEAAIADANEIITRAQLAANYQNNLTGTTGAQGTQQEIDLLSVDAERLAADAAGKTREYGKARAEWEKLDNTISSVQSGVNPNNIGNEEFQRMQDRFNDLTDLLETSGQDVATATTKAAEIDAKLAELVKTRESELTAALGSFSAKIAQEGAQFKADATKLLDVFLDPNLTTRDAGRPAETIFSIEPILKGDYQAVVAAREDLLALTEEEKQKLSFISAIRIDSNLTLEQTLEIVTAIATQQTAVGAALETELSKRQAIVAAITKGYEVQGKIFDEFKAAEGAQLAIEALNEEFTTSNLEGYRSAMRELVSTNIEAGTSISDTIAKVNEQYVAFVETASAAGLGAAQVQELAAALGILPADITVTLQLANLDQFLAGIEKAANAVNFLAPGLGGRLGTGFDAIRERLNAADAANDRTQTGSLSPEIRALISGNNAAARAAAAPKGPKEKDPLEEFAKKQEQALDRIKSGLDSAANALENAAESFKATIKERVQLERGVSVNRAIRNADQQSALLREFTSGITALKQRGVNDDTLKALEIDGISDIRQVRKLLSANPTDLTRLVGSVGNRDRLAQDAAKQAAANEQKKIITDAIVAAAAVLGISNLSPAQAQTIIEQVNINGGTSVTADQLLNMLSQQARP